MLSTIRFALQRYVHRLAWFLVPSHTPCHLCGLPRQPQDHSLWCYSCYQSLFCDYLCPRCGLQLTTEEALCGQCLMHPPYWQRLYCLGDYQFPLDQYIHKLKYQQQPHFATDLATLLAKRIDDPAPVMIPVPLFWRRQWQRGYNQSELIAQALSHVLGNRTMNALKRTRHTHVQRGLTRKERQKNLSGAIALSRSCQALPHHVALVDDVVTTGSTLNAICPLLLELGVKKIDIYCICRTGDPRSKS